MRRLQGKGTTRTKPGLNGQSAVKTADRGTVIHNVAQHAIIHKYGFRLRPALDDRNDTTGMPLSWTL
jgi:hypothetical protein